MYQIEHYELGTQHAVGLTLHAGSMVRVGHGRLWLTQPGQMQDVWLRAGESWTQPATGLVWLSAEPSAQFQLAHVVRPWPGLRYLRQLFPARLRGRSWPYQASQAKDRFIAI